jgi:6-pyruvoyltetrahydropterin/6-carboxytetrahydropterin synthase
MIYITKRVSFSAAHRLYNPSKSEAENEALYDKCNNYNGHGHNYVLEVTLCGVPDPESGYLMDLKKLKALLNDIIVSKVDHKHLNFDVDFLQGIIPTVENLAITFWKLLENELDNCKLYEIKLSETENSWAVYRGEPIDIKKFQ